ncbi:MAG: hypothetical protein K2Y04_09570, partial [Caulobacteraceae bacterium]|nr:hypothetical protein [Caulobacteraceae bacterium]
RQLRRLTLCSDKHKNKPLRRPLESAANELNSPLQFGQATRLTLDNGVPGVVTGVRHPHLSDDFLVEYTRVLSANTFLTLGAAYSIPGVGLKDVVAPRRLSNWAGAFANLVVRY